MPIKSVKCVIGDVCRRFPFTISDEEASYNLLVQKIVEVFGIPLFNSITIRYVDEDGDYVSCSSDKELLDACSFVSPSGTVLRIFVDYDSEYDFATEYSGELLQQIKQQPRRLQPVETKERSLIDHPKQLLLNEVTSYPRKKLFRDLKRSAHLWEVKRGTKLLPVETAEGTLLNHPRELLLNDVQRYPRTRLLKSLKSFDQANLQPVHGSRPPSSHAPIPSPQELHEASRSLRSKDMHGQFQPSLLRFARSCLQPGPDVQLASILAPSSSKKVNVACEHSLTKFLEVLSELLESVNSIDPAQLLLAKHNNNVQSAIMELLKAV